MRREKSPYYGLYGIYFIRGGLRDSKFSCLLPVLKVGRGRVQSRRLDAIKTYWLDAVELGPFAVLVCDRHDSVRWENEAHRIFENDPFGRVLHYWRNEDDSAVPAPECHQPKEWFTVSKHLAVCFARCLAHETGFELREFEPELMVKDGGLNCWFEEWVVDHPDEYLADGGTEDSLEYLKYFKETER